MSNKKFKLKEEKAVFADIRSAISIAIFDSEISNYDGSIDTDVRRAVMYNKIVFENLVKRLFSYYSSREDKKDRLKGRADSSCRQRRRLSVFRFRSRC